MADTSSTTVPLQDQIKCVAREIALRKACYPKWISSGKMKPTEALKELTAMQAVMETLQDLHAQPRLF